MNWEFDIQKKWEINEESPITELLYRVEELESKVAMLVDDNAELRYRVDVMENKLDDNYV
jgi:BMFP domain-containing protein YqiC